MQSYSFSIVSFHRISSFPHIISYYLVNKEILWPNDYIWCNTYDSSGDQIYVGRYFDPLSLSKPGYSIHRHLSIKKNYVWV